MFIMRNLNENKISSRIKSVFWEAPWQSNNQRFTENAWTFFRIIYVFLCLLSITTTEVNNLVSAQLELNETGNKTFKS